MIERHLRIYFACNHVIQCNLTVVITLHSLEMNLIKIVGKSILNLCRYTQPQNIAVYDFKYNKNTSLNVFKKHFT